MDQKDDPFFRTFFQRIGPEAARSFTDAQLDSIKLAFGARGFTSHALDMRLSIPLFFARLYIVLLVGRERRHAPRLRHAIMRLGRTTFAVLLLLAMLILMILALYPVKTAAGIDIFEHGGLHDWVINPLIEQMKRLFG